MDDTLTYIHTHTNTHVHTHKHVRTRKHPPQSELQRQECHELCAVPHEFAGNLTPEILLLMSVVVEPIHIQGKFHTDMHTDVCIYMRTHIYKCTHNIYIYIYMCIYIYIHIYIYTYICIYV